MKTKTYIFIVLLIILSGIVKAQTPITGVSFNLYDNQSGATKTYEARDYIKLTNGFSFSTSDGNKFTAKLNENLLFPVSYVTPTDPTTYNIDQSLPVGTIPGQFNVSATGAANYTIPIEVAPGTAGMQPNLSIVYNSQSGNGLLGLGWNISGLSAITRGPRTNYFDGVDASINYDIDDKFYIDGIRLINENGTYGLSGSNYKKEIYDFSNITFLGDDVGFEIETKDGILLEFGKTENSRLKPKIENGNSNATLIWSICKITDRFGNFMNFTYDLDLQNGECDIKEINYTGNDISATVPFNKIYFYYESRNTDDNLYYIGGNSIKSSKLLRKIKIEANNYLYNTYSFNYIFDTYTKLNNIEYSVGNNQKINKTFVFYGNEQGIDNFDTDFQTEIVDENINNFNYEIIPMNFNGDGNIDFIVSLKSYDISNNYYSYGDFYLFDNKDKSLLPNYISNAQYYKPFIDRRFKDDNFTEYISSDYNGDGIDDLLCYKISNLINNSYYYLYAIRIYFGNTNNSLAFQYPVDFDITSLPNKKIKKENLNNFIITGDFNNDRSKDFVLLLSNNLLNQYYSYMYFPVNGINFFEVQQQNNFNISNLLSSTNVKITDFNANNLNEVAYTTNNSLNIFEFKLINNIIMPVNIYSNNNFINSKIYEGDFNGDGLTDFLTTLNDGTYQIKYSTGNNFDFNSNIIQININNPYLITGDYNGDGKTDLLFINTFTKHDITIYYYVGYEKYIVNNYYSDRIIFTDNIIRADINGDGNTELVCKSDNNQKIILFFNQNKRNFLVTKIIDGFGRKTGITYINLSYQYTQSEWNNNEEFFRFYPNFVVFETYFSNGTVNSGGEGLTYLYYTYQDAYYNKLKKSFLGFNKITTTRFIVPGSYQIVNEKIFVDYSDNINDNYCGLLPYSNSTYYNTPNNKITELFEYRFTNFGNHSNFIYKYKNTDINDINSTQTIATDLFNIDGNLETQTVNIGNDIQKISNFTYSSAGLTIPHKLSNSDVETNYLSEDPPPPPFTQIESFDYDNYTGALLHHYKNDVTTTYEEYNDFGSPQKVTVSSTGLQNKISRFEYDNTGRFVIKETKEIPPASYVSTATYDQVMAVVKTKTDINNHTTAYYYDNFGILKKTHFADGSEANISSQFITDPLIPNALYYSEATATNSPFVKIYYDKLGREILTKTNDFNDNIVKTYTNYNNKGQITEKSEPYFDGETPLLTTYTYDNYGRVENVNTFGISTTNYQYNGLITTVTNNATQQLFTKTTNAAGQIVTSTDAGGTISYNYYSSGLPHIISSNGATTTMEYDTYGRQRLLIDPDAGTTEYHYNTYGELEYQIDNKGFRYDMTYDVLGRLLTKTGPEGNYLYTYDEDLNNKGTLSMETAPGGISTSYNYDNLGRISKTIQNIQGNIFDFSYQYDNFGNLKEETYPSGFTIENMYNQRGFLTQVNNKQTSQPIWELLDVNSKGQPLELSLGNGLHTMHEYDPYGYLYRIATFTNPSYMPDIQDYIYQFTPEWGRPEHRYNMFGNWEYFYYDEDGSKLNRLSRVTVTTNPAENISMQYSLNGNITSKTGLGTYSYNGLQPHAVTAIDNTNSIVSTDKQEIGYTPFNKVSYIKEKLITSGGLFYEKKLYFTYGTANQRVKTEYFDNDIQKTKYFAGNYEQEIINGNTRELHYIAGPMGLAAVYVKNGTTDTMYYTHTDHLGSITEITDNTGTLLQRMAYNAWGKRELLVSNTGNNNFLFDRGYTGHEHLDQFSLINMNGRLYDPVLGRMLSPDNYVQNATNTQGFNRYSYCLNNPMVYTDPDGEFIWAIAAFIIRGGYDLLTNNWQGWEGSGKPALLAGISVAAGGYASSLTGISSTGFYGGTINGAIGGFTSGFIYGSFNSWTSGGSIQEGLIAGTKSGLVGGTIGGLTGGIAGGISSIRHGGDFWTGEGTTYNTPADMFGSPESSDPVDYSTNSAKEFSDKNIDFEPKGLNKLYADNSVPPRYTLQGDVAIGPDNMPAQGATRYLGIQSGKSDVYLWSRAFSSKKQLYFVMKHEYIHVAYYSGGKMNYSRQEASARQWMRDQGAAWNYKADILQIRYHEMPLYSRMFKYNYSNLGIIILDKTPW